MPSSTPEAARSFLVVSKIRAVMLSSPSLKVILIMGLLLAVELWLMEDTTTSVSYVPRSIVLNLIIDITYSLDLYTFRVNGSIIGRSILQLAD